MAYNENQPRVPAGSSEGGQWTAGDATEAIQKAASDNKNKIDEYLKRINESEDRGDLPSDDIFTDFRKWFGSANRVRMAPDDDEVKQLFLKGVEQRTNEKILYRGEAYANDSIAETAIFNHLVNNFYKKDNVVDFSKPMELPNETIKAGHRFTAFDYRLSSYTKDYDVARNFSFEGSPGGTRNFFHKILISVKNEKGLKGFDIGRFSAFNEKEVVVGDHAKYHVDNVEVKGEENAKLVYVYLTQL